MILEHAPRFAASAAGAGAASVAAYSAVMWARYGHVDLTRHPKDDLMDRFMPDPEADEYHHVAVNAPAATALAAGVETDVQASPLIRAIFSARELPTALRGKPLRPAGPRGILAEVLDNGFGVLAEESGREIVIGTYTQPWQQEVTFHTLPPTEFAGFREPGFVKIAVSFGADSMAPDRSVFFTRTRVLATDAEARRKFRLYWAPISAGIILIRYFYMPMVKREAERRVRAERESVAVGV